MRIFEFHNLLKTNKLLKSSKFRLAVFFDFFYFGRFRTDFLTQILTQIKGHRDHLKFNDVAGESEEDGTSLQEIIALAARFWKKLPETCRIGSLLRSSICWRESFVRKASPRMPL